MLSSSPKSPNLRRAIVADMRQRWTKLLDELGVDPADYQEVFEMLVALYNGPDRFYHDLSHIQDLLNIVAGFKDHIQDYTAMRLAIWFHDAIYDASAKDNEAKSAGLAKRTLARLGLPSDLVLRVQELILATDGHHAVPHDLDAQILLDADLSPLGASLEAFTQDGLDLLREAPWLSEAEYPAARRKVLESFLERDRLYQTEWFHDRFEAQAKGNMVREIKRLKALEDGQDS